MTREEWEQVLFAHVPDEAVQDTLNEYVLELESESEKLKRRIEILKANGIEIADAVAGGFEIYDREHALADRLQAENARLREYATKLETANFDVTARLADYIGQYDPTDALVIEAKVENEKLQEENARLRSCLSDDAENARQILGENANLWKLVRMFADYVSQDRCEGCVLKRRCNDGEVEECWQRTEIRKAAHELGIEVD